MQKFESILKAWLLMLAFTLLFLVSPTIANNDNSAKDSSAIFGGQIEEGYLSSGYLVAQKQISERTFEYTTCGIVFISDTKAYTAAHCIKDESTFLVGTGEFDIRSSDLINPSKITKHPNWDGVTRQYDIALIEFERDTNIDFASVTNPSEGCGYTIVGYGLNETDNESSDPSKTRKSLKVCVELVTDELIYLSSENGNVCFGDSGSPIFGTDTNQVVGVLSAIFTQSEDYKEFCTEGGNSVAVRLDYFESFMREDSTENIEAEEQIIIPVEPEQENSQTENEFVYVPEEQEFVQNSTFIDQNRSVLIQGTLVLIAIDIATIALMRLKNFF